MMALLIFFVCPFSFLRKYWILNLSFLIFVFTHSPPYPFLTSLLFQICMIASNLTRVPTSMLKHRKNILTINVHLKRTWMFTVKTVCGAKKTCNSLGWQACNVKCTFETHLDVYSKNSQSSKIAGVSSVST